MPAETIAPPSPPPTESTAPPASPPAEPSLKTGTTGQVVDRGPAPTPPKKGSAKEAMFQELQKRAQASEPKPEPAKPAEPAEPKPAEPSSAPAGDAADKKKVSPWKLVDEYKGRAAKLEQELAETKKTIVDPKEKEQLTTKLVDSEKRIKELEEEIRYVNYSKHPEFQEKYKKPYEDAWKRAMNELSELTVEDGSGQERPMTSQDMLTLVNMPIKEARAMAVKQYGDFADDVMAHRKEIRRLFDAQSEALENARKDGTAREEQLRIQAEAAKSESKKKVGELWTKVNNEVTSHETHGPYFKPVEGDEEGNQRLARGYELADKAFSGIDPTDPRLSPEQREEIIRVHAAVRHRAAAYGRTRFWLEKAREEVKSLKAELEKFKGAQPGSGEGAKPDSAKPTRAWDQVMSELQKRAH